MGHDIPKDGGLSALEMKKIAAARSEAARKAQVKCSRGDAALSLDFVLFFSFCSGAA